MEQKNQSRTREKVRKSEVNAAKPMPSEAQNQLAASQKAEQPHRVNGYKAKIQAWNARVAAQAEKSAALEARGAATRKAFRTKLGAETPNGGEPSASSASRYSPKPPFFLKRKPEAVMTLPNGERLELRGLASPGHERYVLISDGRSVALIPYHAWHGGSGDATRLLVANRITVVASMSDLRAQVSKLRRFPVVPIADNPGWAGPIFATAGGRLIAPPKVKNSFSAFAPDPEICAIGGTREGWTSGVAEPLASHLLASFLFMAMFAGPLLRLTNRSDNFGFEVAGAAGLGKSTIQMLAASAAGRAFGGEGSTYWRTCNTTTNALETILPSYNDMTLVLDEAGLAPGSGKKDERASQIREMAFRLSSGRSKHRYGERPEPPVRLIYILSTNQPLSELTGQGCPPEAQAVADRLMTLPLLDSRRYGIFDNCPPGYASPAVFADSLKREASEHFGHAVPAFLEYLVKRRALNPNWLDQVVMRRQAKFLAAARADMSSGSSVRVASAFALVYVAGLLAKWAGVLPASYRPLAAALAAYQLHRDYGRPALSFADRLRALARHPGTIDLAKVDQNAIDKDAQSACLAYLYTNRSGGRELLIPAKMRSRALPDWNRIRNESDVVKRLKVSEGDRNTNDRPIPGAKKQVYCFDLSDLGI
jgi:hypothetical protein